MPPRTIDNLGYDASQRYAMDQHLLSEVGPKFQKEHPTTLKQAQIDVTSPSFKSEVDVLLQSDHNKQAWAEFHPPVGFTDPRTHSFTHQLLPFLSDPNQQELYKKKIAEKSEHNSQDEQQRETEDGWELSQRTEEEEKEKNTLLNLLNCVSQINSCMIYVSTKRSQYHKG